MGITMTSQSKKEYVEKCQVQRRFLNARTSNQNMQQGRALDAAPVHCLSLSCDICIFLIFVFVFISGWSAHFAFHLWHWIFSKTCLAIDEIHLSQPQATESFTPEKSRHWHGASLALADGFYVFIFKSKHLLDPHLPFLWSWNLNVNLRNWYV